MTKSDAHPGINRRQMLQSVAGLGAGALASSYPLAGARGSWAAGAGDVDPLALQSLPRRMEDRR